MSHDTPQGGCEIEQPVGYYCSRSFSHNGPCALHSTAIELPVGGNSAGIRSMVVDPVKSEFSGGPVNYYLVTVTVPNQGTVPYQAECGDIIEALGMDFNEACEFKAIWRTAAARTLGKAKQGGDAKYDAEKRVFYAKRSLRLLTAERHDAKFAVDNAQMTLDQAKDMMQHMIDNAQMTLDQAKDMMQHMVDNVPGFKELLK